MEREELQSGDMLRPELLLEGLGSSLFSTNIVFREITESTNILAGELAADGAPEGTIVVAERQTGGRGRMGRKWLSPAGVNLLVSILLRPDIKIERVYTLTMILALATIDAIESETGIQTRIKWPNDLYVSGRKIGGMLTEFSVFSKSVRHVVLGLGLNVNWDPGEEHDLAYPATSLMKETGKAISRNRLLVLILGNFDKYYKDVLAERIDLFHERWNDLSIVTGKYVEIESEKGRTRGTVLRIDRNGAIVIRQASGKETKVFCGDVSIRLGNCEQLKIREK